MEPGIVGDEPAVPRDLTDDQPGSQGSTEIEDSFGGDDLLLPDSMRNGDEAPDTVPAPPSPSPESGTVDSGEVDDFADEPSNWRARKRDGTILEFPDLACFHQWVSDGIITIDDQISRFGNPWRRIAEVPELVGLCEMTGAPQPVATAEPAEQSPPTDFGAPQLTSKELEMPDGIPGIGTLDGLDEGGVAASHGMGLSSLADDLLIPKEDANPDMVGTVTDFRLDPTQQMTDSQEMALAGSTLEMQVPDAAFSLGPSINGQLDPSLAAEPGAPQPFDPSAATVPAFNLGAEGGLTLPPSMGDDGADLLADPVGGPTLDPGRHIEPVKAQHLPGADAPFEVPITGDETGNLHMGLMAKVILGSLALVMVGSIYYAFTRSSVEEGESGEKPTAEESRVQDKKQVQDVANKSEQNADVAVNKEALAKLGKGHARQAENSARRGRNKVEYTAVLIDNSKNNNKKAKEKAARKNKKALKKKAEKPKPNAKEEPKVAHASYDGLMSAASKALKSGASKRAIHYLREAAKLNPRSVEPIAKMGWAYLKMGNPTQAILKFEEVRQKNPGYRNTYVGLGKALERAGRTQAAIAAYRKYLVICPKCRKSERAKAALLRLGVQP
jgi:Flp pilus assembly protein TadD